LLPGATFICGVHHRTALWPGVSPHSVSKGEIHQQPKSEHETPLSPAKSREVRVPVRLGRHRKGHLCRQKRLSSVRELGIDIGNM
jgi:hypothetical protein